MRAVSACLLFAIAAAVVSADSCTAPTSDALNATSASSCSAVTACQAALCLCAGGSASSSGLSCLAGSTKTCANVTLCLSGYFACLTALSSLRNSNSSGAACTAYGSALYMNQLAAATTVSSFNTSNLYNSCTYGVCTLLNATGVTGCNSSAVYTAACASTVLLKDAVGPTPTPTTTMGVYAVTATFQLAGQNWTQALSDPVAYANLVSSIKDDLAQYFGIDGDFIVILDLSIGSLIIQFAVLDGSGKSTSALVTAANGASAPGANVFPSVTTFYANYGTDTPSVTVSSVATPPPTPAPSSAMNVAVLAAAAVAAAATLFA